MEEGNDNWEFLRPGQVSITRISNGDESLDYDILTGTLDKERAESQRQM